MASKLSLKERPCWSCGVILEDVDVLNKRCPICTAPLINGFGAWHRPYTCRDMKPLMGLPLYSYTFEIAGVTKSVDGINSLHAVYVLLADEKIPQNLLNTSTMTLDDTPINLVSTTDSREVLSTQ